MYGWGTPEGVPRRFRQPEVPNLPGGDELCHRAHRVLDRQVGIRSVLVVEVDVIDAEPLQRRVARAAYILRSAIDGTKAAVVGTAPAAELRREPHLFARAGDRPAD